MGFDSSRAPQEDSSSHLDSAVSRPIKKMGSESTNRESSAITSSQATHDFDVDIGSRRQLHELQRLEQTHGRKVHDWLDEGMPREAMGTPSEMDAFRTQTNPAGSQDIGGSTGQSIQRSTAAAVDTSPASDTGVSDSVGEVISSPGQSLDGTVQRMMEDEMGGSFDGVQIHTGSTAANACEDINARAFTVGNHIAFNQGEYEPATPAGQHVLAHELTHVRQQNGSVNRLVKNTPGGDKSSSTESRIKVQRAPKKAPKFINTDLATQKSKDLSHILHNDFTNPKQKPNIERAKLLKDKRSNIKNWVDDLKESGENEKVETKIREKTAQLKHEQQLGWNSIAEKRINYEHMQKTAHELAKLDAKKNASTRAIELSGRLSIEEKKEDNHNNIINVLNQIVQQKEQYDLAAEESDPLNTTDIETLEADYSRWSDAGIGSDNSAMEHKKHVEEFGAKSEQDYNKKVIEMMNRRGQSDAYESYIQDERDGSSLAVYDPMSGKMTVGAKYRNEAQGWEQYQIRTGHRPGPNGIISRGKRRLYYSGDLIGITKRLNSIKNQEFKEQKLNEELARELAKKQQAELDWERAKSQQEEAERLAQVQQAEEQQQKQQQEKKEQIQATKRKEKRGKQKLKNQVDPLSTQQNEQGDQADLQSSQQNGPPRNRTWLEWLLGR